MFQHEHSTFKSTAEKNSHKTFQWSDYVIGLLKSKYKGIL